MTDLERAYRNIRDHGVNHARACRAVADMTGIDLHTVRRLLRDAGQAKTNTTGTTRAVPLRGGHTG